MADFAELRRQIALLDELTRDAYVEEVLVIPMAVAAARVWKRMADSDDDSWASYTGGGWTFAVDQCSRQGALNLAAAVVFPSVHSQLLGWWLFHAWRSIDLLKAGLDASANGATSVAAVTSRALIEELGCLVTEVRLVQKAWETAKLPALPLLRRVELVRSELAPMLAKLLSASRMSKANAPSATNVLTYVSKLDKLSKSTRFTDWYDWLSDASHPALGARLVHVTNPMRHESGAVVLRFHSRSPLHLLGPRGERTDFTYDVESKARAALETCGSLLFVQLYAALKIVDDFGLTTSAPPMTERSYWRDLLPAPPGDECPCGCGPWAESLHAWGAKAPYVPAITADGSVI